MRPAFTGIERDARHVAQRILQVAEALLLMISAGTTLMDWGVLRMTAAGRSSLCFLLVTTTVSTFVPRVECHLNQQVWPLP